MHELALVPSEFDRVDRQLSAVLNPQTHQLLRHPVAILTEIRFCIVLDGVPECAALVRHGFQLRQKLLLETFQRDNGPLTTKELQIPFKAYLMDIYSRSSLKKLLHSDPM